MRPSPPRRKHRPQLQQLINRHQNCENSSERLARRRAAFYFCPSEWKRWASDCIGIATPFGIFAADLRLYFRQSGTLQNLLCDNVSTPPYHRWPLPACLTFTGRLMVVDGYRRREPTWAAFLALQNYSLKNYRDESQELSHHFQQNGFNPSNFNIGQLAGPQSAPSGLKSA
jgi:hypothetical protein